MKSDIQIRAERAFERFETARKPVVLEFAGVPKAGKTTTLNALAAFLKRCGFRVEVVIERASVCPIRDKRHVNFNVWTACTTLAQILEKTQTPPRQDDPHVLILDRGLFDTICWVALMERLERVRSADRQIIEKFLRIDDWRKRISAVFVMTVSPSDAMSREKGLLPVEGGKGSIMNHGVLQRMLDTTKEAANKMKRDFRIFEIDTSSQTSTAEKTAETVARLTLDVIEEHLREDILSLPKEDVINIFKENRFLGSADAKELINKFATLGNYEGRESVEANDGRVQALPVVVVRKKSGEVLRLRRREESEKKPLHEKIVLWAGGHVRKEDDTNGNSIVQCALRELHEELRLSIEPNELELKGALYSGLSAGTSKHVAIVYEWKAPHDDVAITLSSSEFFERRGTSLSGTFVPIKVLAEDVENGKLTEEWSTTIVREFLAKGDYTFSPRLF